MPANGSARKRLDEYIRLKAINKSLMKSPRFKGQSGKITVEIEYNRDKVNVAEVFSEEQFDRKKEVNEVKPADREKEVQEKMKILEEIVKLGTQVSKESFQEFYEIGERRDEDWGE